jgi:predicted HicB family RNase H-like nuclease
MVEQRRKTGTLNLRIDPNLKSLAEKAAADDRRSLTSLVEKLLADHLKAKGYLK